MVDGTGNVKYEAIAQEAKVMEDDGVASMNSIDVARGGVPFGGDKMLFVAVAVLLHFESDEEFPESHQGVG